MYTMFFNAFAQTVPPAVTDSITDKGQELSMLKTLSFDEFLNKVISQMVTFSINLAIAIIVFIIGRFIINKIHNLLTSVFVKRNVDKSLSTFVLSLVRIVLFFILIVTVIGILGIETSSFLAIFASAGVALGMALSGTLQNFAGGVLILLLKPYKVGDYIEASGYAGTVKEIQIFNTVIVTPDNKSIIIPNGGLSTGSINNFSREPLRRIEWAVSISYGDDVDVARKVILDIIDADDRIVRVVDETKEDQHDAAQEQPIGTDAEKERRGIFDRLFHRQKSIRAKIDDWENNMQQRASSLLASPQRDPAVYLSQLADSSVNLVARAWTRNEHYWGVFFDINEKIYKELPKHGINFPFPQLDVHMS